MTTAEVTDFGELRSTGSRPELVEGNRAEHTEGKDNGEDNSFATELAESTEGKGNNKARNDNCIAAEEPEVAEEGDGESTK